MLDKVFGNSVFALQAITITLEVVMILLWLYFSNQKEQ